MSVLACVCGGQSYVEMAGRPPSASAGTGSATGSASSSSSLKSPPGWPATCAATLRFVGLGVLKPGCACGWVLVWVWVWMRVRMGARVRKGVGVGVGRDARGHGCARGYGRGCEHGRENMGVGVGRRVGVDRRVVSGGCVRRGAPTCGRGDFTKYATRHTVVVWLRSARARELLCGRAVRTPHPTHVPGGKVARGSSSGIPHCGGRQRVPRKVQDDCFRGRAARASNGENQEHINKRETGLAATGQPSPVDCCRPPPRRASRGRRKTRALALQQQTETLTRRTFGFGGGLGPIHLAVLLVLRGGGEAAEELGVRLVGGKARGLAALLQLFVRCRHG